DDLHERLLEEGPRADRARVGRPGSPPVHARHSTPSGGRAGDVRVRFLRLREVACSLRIAAIVPREETLMAPPRTLVVVLAGGAGSRLGVLTEHRAKPAVRFGGTHRLIDFPLSNARNAGIDDVWVLLQYHP